MGLFSKKRDDQFEFIVDFDFNLFQIDGVSDTIIEKTREFHIKQHELMKRHIDFLLTNYKKYTRKKNFIYKSCMEFASFYFYIFSSEFTINLTNKTIPQLYFTSLFYNFNNFNKIIHSTKYTEFTQFLSLKYKYFHFAFSNLTDISLASYFNDIFIEAPFEMGEPSRWTMPELNIIKLAPIAEYYQNSYKEISKQAQNYIYSVKS